MYSLLSCLLSRILALVGGMGGEFEGCKTVPAAMEFMPMLNRENSSEQSFPGRSAAWFGLGSPVINCQAWL